MEKCILCGGRIKNRQIEEGLFFNRGVHYEYNVNIISLATDGPTYVETSDSKGNRNEFHLDGTFVIDDVNAEIQREIICALESVVEHLKSERKTSAESEGATSGR